MTPVSNVLPDDLVIESGGHDAASKQFCVMEAVAWVAGEPWSDQPQCACPVISAFLRSWNDAIPDTARRTALLAPLVARLVDSRSTNDVELRRSYLAFDWLARVQGPAWMDLTPALVSHAGTLRACPPQLSKQAIAAWDAAWAAAWDAAWDAAGAALQPTVVALQISALVLVDRMLAITPETTDAEFLALADWPVIERVAAS